MASRTRDEDKGIFDQERRRLIVVRQDAFKRGFLRAVRAGAGAPAGHAGRIDEETKADYKAGEKAGKRVLEEAANEYLIHLNSEYEWPLDPGQGFRHCDDYINDPRAPQALRAFLLRHRLPAADGLVLAAAGFNPKLYADYTEPGKPSVVVRVTMASRFGDLGITTRLAQDSGYEQRVPVAMLSNFRGEK